jgi:hypothetical protein
MSGDTLHHIIRWNVAFSIFSSATRPFASSIVASHVSSKASRIIRTPFIRFAACFPSRITASALTGSTIMPRAGLLSLLVNELKGILEVVDLLVGHGLDSLKQIFLLTPKGGSPTTVPPLESLGLSS